MSIRPRIGIIIAARMSSNRLPGKALKPIQHIPMIQFLLRRVKGSQLVDDIILATSNQMEDDILEEIAAAEKINIFRGSLENVTDRYVCAAKHFQIDTVIRITGDCPFVNSEIIDFCINSIDGRDYDLCTTKGSFPVGLDVEIYHNKTMDSINQMEMSVEEKEHLTLYYYNHRKNHFNISIHVILIDIFLFLISLSFLIY